MDYVKRIRSLRRERELSQQQVAQVLGISQTMLARYERGANALPIRHLIALSRFYDVSSDYLLGLSDRPR